MTLTHWFLLFGGLTIIAITIDGVRRMVTRPSILAIDLDETLQNLPVEEYRAELPNGGARAVSQVIVPVVVYAVVTEQVADVTETITSEAEDLQVDELSSNEFVEELSIEELDITAELEANTELLDAELGNADLSEEVELEVAATPVVEIEEVQAETVIAEEVAVEEMLEQEVVADLAEEIATDRAPEFDLSAPEETQSESHVADENPLVAAFDPTRPVHETVESHKMVQSDMFADVSAEQEEMEALGEWQEYADLEDDISLQADEEVQEVLHAEQADELVIAATDVEELTSLEVEPVATSSDDILLTDTGLDEVENQADTLGARLAKVTSFTFGKKMLENRRKQAEEAQALEDIAQAEGSVVANVEQVLSIIVAAKDPQGFYGSNLKGLVEACGMVHGGMDLFHRYEDGLTEGQTQFSMANMTESGAFDIDTMANVHTAGVVFFMTLPSANDSIRAFDYMVETAQCLANNLGGELYDENRSVLRAQTVEHYRQRIREFERQRLSRRAHGGS